MKKNKTIGEIIKEFREKKKISQKEIASILDVSRITIYNYENDKTPIPINNLLTLKDILDIPDNCIEFIDEMNKNSIDGFYRLNFLLAINQLEKKDFQVIQDKKDNVIIYKDNKILLNVNKNIFTLFCVFEKLEIILNNDFESAKKETAFINFLKINKIEISFHNGYIELKILKTIQNLSLIDFYSLLVNSLKPSIEFITKENIINLKNTSHINKKRTNDPNINAIDIFSKLGK